MPPRAFEFEPPAGEIVLRWPPNWTAVFFFGTLASLHTVICVAAFLHSRWEGYMSAIFAVLFWSLSLICYRLEARLVILPPQKRVHVQLALGPFLSDRIVHFETIRGVRLTICNNARHADSRIELLCHDEDISCPPTDIPREQALFLAMTLDVELTKAFADNAVDSDRIDQISPG